jgi:hypothetical protein
MQEQIQFKLSDEFLKESAADEISVLKELQENIQSIEALLQSYHFKARGRVFDIVIKDDSLTLLSNTMAKLQVTYLVGQFNACADLDFNERAGMEMLVDIERESSQAIVTGEFIPEREPDEI